MASKGFRCQLRAEARKDEAELLIYDEIGKSFWGDGVDAKTVVQALGEITAKTIRVRIHSGGGDVFDALAMYAALRSHGAKIITENDALCASAASFLFLAGDERRMADTAFLMIHNPHSGQYGTAEDMREMADLLDKVGGGLVNLYVEGTGQDEEQVRAWMKAETWFTAEEAKEAGFVTAVMKGKKIAACADLSAFSNAPAALRAAADLFAASTTTTTGADGTASVTLSLTTHTPTAAGGAAPDPTPAPNTPADQAKGDNPMSDQDKAALLATERARVKAIRAIGQEHNIEATLVDSWLDDEKSIDEVRGLVLEQIRAKAQKSPKVTTTTVRARAEDDPARGFESHRDFLLSVIENKGAQTREGVKDERLRPLAVSDDEGPGMAYILPRAFSPKKIRAAAGSDEQGNYSDTYGGFLQPRQVLPGLRDVAFEGDPTAGLTTMVPMSAPIVAINARTDKNHTSSVSGGLTFTRTPETATATSSRMAIEQIELKAAPLVGLAYATEAVITDSPISFAALLAAGFDAQRAAHILNEKIRGGGGNEYMGILSAACKVEVSKETGQSADTINYDNILKMRARCWGYGNAIWIANHDTLPQLGKLSLAIGTGGQAVFIPGQFGMSPDTLLGRPLVFSEYMNTVGDAGDIALVNWTQYLEGVYQPMKSDESIHVRFTALERTFRFYERNCGAPWWRSALTPAKGSNTLSPIVTLAARA